MGSLVSGQSNINSFFSSAMIQFMPVPDDQRFSFHLKVFENCHPVFGDKTVIVLMLLFVISNNEDDWNIR